jgi:heterodisulfide reductase subunit C/nitrate reductase gamma subunit
MFFDLLLYASLVVFGIGLVYRIHRWFSGHITTSAGASGSAQRLGQAIRGILGVLFSVRVVAMFKALLLDVILQRRILKESAYRWAMHMLIFVGFVLLLLMHALENWISMPLFEDYTSTANPYFFLRGVFGLMVVAGIVMAAFRRRAGGVPRLRTKAMDRYVLAIIAVIMVSGFLLEGAKILSYSDYRRMVADYADTGDPEELQALEAYWVQEMGVFSPRMEGPFDEDLIEEGLELHEMSCQYCHAPSQWAFVGYGLSRAMHPVAGFLEDMAAVDIFWTIHILACFFGLAYLPFSKMFHVMATPISLVCNAVMDTKRSLPANIATRQMLELDACARCGTCSLRCSSAPAFEAMGNDAILPSERMQILKRLSAGKRLSDAETKAVRDGIIICTNCDRCTVVCPSGINLRDLWINVREDLIQAQGQPLLLSGFSFARALYKDRIPADEYEKSLVAARQSVMDQWKEAHGPTDAPLTPDRRAVGAQGASLQDTGSFRACFGCQNCTTVCPVVAGYPNPREELGLLPHQIMYSLGLGLVDRVCTSRMLWACTTCYQCQEHCPQMVEVTDILYDLKIMALKGPSKGIGQAGARERAA